MRSWRLVASSVAIDDVEVMVAYAVHHLTGHAVLRFSDGRRPLFRGDGPLAGLAAAIG